MNGKKSVRMKTRKGDLADRAAHKPGSKQLPKATKSVAKGFIKGVKAANEMKNLGKNFKGAFGGK